MKSLLCCLSIRRRRSDVEDGVITCSSPLQPYTLSSAAPAPHSQCCTASPPHLHHQPWASSYQQEELREGPELIDRLACLPQPALLRAQPAPSPRLLEEEDSVFTFTLAKNGGGFVLPRHCPPPTHGLVSVDLDSPISTTERQLGFSESRVPFHDKAISSLPPPHCSLPAQARGDHVNVGFLAGEEEVLERKMAGSTVPSPPEDGSTVPSPLEDGSTVPSPLEDFSYNFLRRKLSLHLARVLPSQTGGGRDARRESSVTVLEHKVNCGETVLTSGNEFCPPVEAVLPPVEAFPPCQHICSGRASHCTEDWQELSACGLQHLSLEPEVLEDCSVLSSPPSVFSPHGHSVFSPPEIVLSPART